ncbi:MAG: VOC family protein [Acidobacteriota bacterium]|nr:VOC family protein [Acidobacteriota bacterium]
MTNRELARLATAVENGEPIPADLPEGSGLIVGVTGPPGAGKSSLVDALTAELRRRGKTVAVIAVDPSSRATGGAILGDRVRMSRHHADAGVFIRSMATRGAIGGLARASAALARLFRGAGFDFVLIETVGVGQDEIDIAGEADVTVVVLTPAMGDEIQAIKAGILEIADLFVINKSDLPGADKAERDLETHVPVIRTVAIDGTGVSELTDRLQSFGRRQAPADLRWEIDHLGIAVRSLDETLPFYAEQLGLPLKSRETVAHEKVNVAMLDPHIELLEALDPSSTMAKFIGKRGPGLHHVALRVSDLNAVIARLERAGVRLLGPPRRGAGGHTYVFVHPAAAGGVLWELIQA